MVINREKQISHMFVKYLYCKNYQIIQVDIETGYQPIFLSEEESLKIVETFWHDVF